MAALRNLDPVYGYTSLSEMGGAAPSFVRAGASDAFFVPDEVIDLSRFLQAPLPPQVTTRPPDPTGCRSSPPLPPPFARKPHEVTFTKHWLAVEGVQPAIPQNPPMAGHADEVAELAEGELKPTATVADGEGGAAEVVAKDVPVVIKPVVRHELSREQQVRAPGGPVQRAWR